MVASERLSPPNVRIVGILDPQHNGGIAHMADVDLATPNEGDACRGAGRAGQSARRLRPLFYTLNTQVYFTNILEMGIFFKFTSSTYGTYLPYCY